MTSPTSVITIMVSDNLMLVSGVPQTVSCTALAAENIHAVQWDGTSGSIEYALINGAKNPPATFTDFSPYQSYLDAWNVANTPAPPPAVTKATLTAYAYAKQTKIAQGGFTVNANTSGAALDVSVNTTTAYANYLSSAVQLAQMMNAGTIPVATINWVQTSGNLALTAAQVINVGVAVSAQVQETFTVLGQVIAAINAGAITTNAQIDTPPLPIPAWPLNS